MSLAPKGKYLRIRVEADGKDVTTPRVFDADTGEPIENIVELHINFVKEDRHLPTATMTIAKTRVASPVELNLTNVRTEIREQEENASTDQE